MRSKLEDGERLVSITFNPKGLLLRFHFSYTLIHREFPSPSIPKDCCYFAGIGELLGFTLTYVSITFNPKGLLLRSK